MPLNFHLTWSTGAAALLLATPAATMVRAQSFKHRTSEAAYQVSTIYDRLTDSTRVAIGLRGTSRPFGLGSRVWLDVSFTYPGRRLTVPPEAVTITLQSFTPARGGWAFSRPQRLRILSGKTLKLEVPAAEYEKLRARLFDAGRREVLSFRIPTPQFVAMAAEPKLELKAGNARMRLRNRAMGMLRDVARRLQPASAEVR